MIPTIFTFSEYWPFYLSFTAFVGLILLIDLGIFNRVPHAVNIKESLIWSLVWIVLAIVFNVLFYFFAKEKAINWFLSNPSFIPNGMTAITAGTELGKNFGFEFFTGYVIEKVLAIDNIFVFIIIFKFFSTPLKFQHKILYFGIIGALIFRAIFISIGASLMQYAWAIIIFGVFLILTGLKMLFSKDNDFEPNKNVLIRLLNKTGRVSKKSYSEINGKFFIKENGKIFMTILFLTLIVVEFTDVVFAIDSVPAIFSITKEPLIVFSSNIFAILGLRALYFTLANIAEKFEYLKYGISIILVFVGLKMVWLNHQFNGKFPISISLSFIFSVFFICILLSFIKNKRTKSS